MLRQLEKKTNLGMFYGAECKAELLLGALMCWGREGSAPPMAGHEGLWSQDGAV